MLNEFAGIQKVSDESLGRDETPQLLILKKEENLFVYVFISAFYTLVKKPSNWWSWSS